ncbi:Fe(3+)-hydroxamate ABC transporter permease FhuB [Paraburkholderia sp. BL21I4N1]|uniref:Fe(3+)-hydroxamate ABC transporter permease FhuB n=1 Tax=Paraburkholderia sp. BL21I4N1 TaxID=1938801 RepID=UPI000D3FB9C0|nr:Fe(3+)-hydroxamate ABC transporter permease FhuB [Paraburkholderia sp. BL21I4N1]PQV54231.1 iron complex transport system permease protein [Paraburkholderia sp. BL21I4N1]
MHDLSLGRSPGVWHARRPLLAMFGLFVFAAALTLRGLASHLPPADWLRAIFSPDVDDIRAMVVHYSWLPRLALSLLCGAALALAGVVLQQVLRNPLAEPMTVGVSAGSYLALLLATLWAPAWLLAWREGVALAGGALAMLFVFVLASRRAFAPTTLVLGGMIVNLYCGAISLALSIIYERSLTAMFIWGGGALAQQDWHTTLWLVPRVVVCAALCAALVRPLTLAGLDDAGARSLGLSLTRTRFLALAAAVALTAFVVAAVGVIGFIGLAAPAIARACGARRLRDQLTWAPVIGALLLWATDQAIQQVGGLAGELLPTGAATALFGGPLLLWLVPRLKARAAPPHAERMHFAIPQAPRTTRRLLIGAALALVAAVVIAAGFGRGVSGWHWATSAEWAGLWHWRAPRIESALAVGALLALAGTLLQRLSGNPMASPEVLGISGGSLLGMIALVLLVRAPGAPLMFVACGVGALATLLAMLALAKRSGFATEQLLLAGIAVGSLSQAVFGLVIAGSGPYAPMLRNLLMGSTYLIDANMASAAVVLAVVLFALALLCTRWLDIFPLGASVSASLGVAVRRARFLILLLAALLSAAAAMIVGPLSFIGLMAPHMARRMGFRRAATELMASTLLGAMLMVVSDWLSRNVLFPQQMPAGLLAMIAGGLYLMWSLGR